MLNREETWDSFFQEVNKHCDRQDSRDRADHRFLVYALAPGTGKTTMLVSSGQEFERRQAAGLLSRRFPRSRVDIFTTFNHHSAVTNLDLAHPQFALVVRMLHAVFGGPTSSFVGCYAALHAALLPAIDHPSLLGSALLAIRQHRVNIGKCGADEPLAINLCLDEFTKMLAPGSTQAERQAPLYTLIKSLGSLLHSQEKFLLIVTMAGTTAVDLDEGARTRLHALFCSLLITCVLPAVVRGSAFEKLQLPLPILTSEQALSYVNAFLQHSSSPLVVTNDSPLMRLVRSVGGWPRPLNELAQLLLKKPAASVEVLFEHLRNALEVRYPAWDRTQSKSEVAEIILSSLAHVPLNARDRWASRVESGLVILSAANTPYLPPLPAYIMLSSLRHSDIFCKTSLNRLLESEVLASFEWGQWEAFICKVLALRLAAYKSRRNDHADLTVGLFLSGGVHTTSTPFLTRLIDFAHCVEPEELVFTPLQHRWPAGGKWCGVAAVCCIFSSYLHPPTFLLFAADKHPLPLTPSPSIYRNGAGSSAIDALMLCHMEDSDGGESTPLYMAIQDKHTIDKAQIEVADIVAWSKECDEVMAAAGLPNYLYIIISNRPVIERVMPEREPAAGRSRVNAKRNELTADDIRAKLEALGLHRVVIVARDQLNDFLPPMLAVGEWAVPQKK